MEAARTVSSDRRTGIPFCRVFRYPLSWRVCRPEGTSNHHSLKITARCTLYMVHTDASNKSINSEKYTPNSSITSKYYYPPSPIFYANAATRHRQGGDCIQVFCTFQ